MSVEPSLDSESDEPVMKSSSWLSLSIPASGISLCGACKNVWCDVLLKISLVGLAGSAHCQNLRPWLQCSQPFSPLDHCVDHLKCRNQTLFKGKQRISPVVMAGKADIARHGRGWLFDLEWYQSMLSVSLSWPDVSVSHPSSVVIMKNSVSPHLKTYHINTELAGTFL